MDNLNWSIIGFVIVALAVGGVVGYFIAPSETTGFTTEEVRVQIDEAIEKGLAIKEAEIDRLKGLIGEFENKIENETIRDTDKDTIETGYLIDELYISDLLGDTYSDREVEILFDGEIDFDGKDYDAEETLILEDIELLANENDFKGNVYMTLPEGAIGYKLEFEDDLNTSLIDEDETLKFNLLGNEVEVIEWKVDEIILTQGKEYFMDEGESVIFNEKVIFLKYVVDDAVRIEIGDVSKKIEEGETARVNGIEIKVKEVTYAGYEGGPQMATLIIGDEVECEFIDGEEYEEDSIWNWKISANSIGLILNEDFTEIDDNEEFPAVGVDEMLCLPNDYVCVRFNGMDEIDKEEYTFDLDGDFVRVKGNFEYGTEDYGKIYVYTNGSIYEDDDLDSYIGEEIELGDTGLVLEKIGEWIEIEDFKVLMNLTSSESNGNDLDSKEDDYLTDFGIKILNPENSAEDFEFEISVPEEKIFGSISLI